MSELVTVPKADTVADLRDDRGAVRSFVSAPVAPATGPIAHAPETPVVTVLKGFWQSPTIKAIRAMVITAFSLAAIASLGLIVSAGNIKAVNWNGVAFAFENAFVIGLAGALFAWLKTRDNNPVNKP